MSLSIPSSSWILVLLHHLAVSSVLSSLLFKYRSRAQPDPGTGKTGAQHPKTSAPFDCPALLPYQANKPPAPKHHHLHRSRETHLSGMKGPF